MAERLVYTEKVVGSIPTLPTMNPFLEQKQIVLNKLLINYYSSGNSSPTLLFLHGWRSEAKIWLPIINSLVQEGKTVYALDLPGFGRSETPSQSFTLADYSEAVARFIEALKLSDVCLIGHSFGGRVAVKLAAPRSDLVQRLVLVASAGIREKSFKRGLFKAAAKIVHPIFKLPFLRPLRKKIYQAIGAEDYVMTPALKNTFIKIINEDVAPLFPKIKQKTLIIWGDQDKETPLKFGRLMAKQIPRAKLEVIKGAGHCSFIDEPDGFLRVLKDFLNEPD